MKQNIIKGYIIGLLLLLFVSVMPLLALDASYYLDRHQLSKEQVKALAFTPMKSPSLLFGYAPEATLWIKVKVTNPTSKSTQKILEIHSLVENALLYDQNSSYQEGMAYKKELLPSFEIELKPHEEKELLLKIDSHYTPLIAKLEVFDKEHFLKARLQYQYTIYTILAILIALLLYNFMIWLFTKDRAYLYYILYLFFVIVLHATYTGALQYLFLSHSQSLMLMYYLPILTALLVMSMIMFARTFLQTEALPKLDGVLKIYLFVTPIVALLALFFTFFRSHFMSMFLPLGIVLIATGIYSYKRGVKEALFYLLGWSFVLIALTTVVLKNLGIFNISHYITYINSKAFLLESFLFSIALAHKIKLLHQENRAKQQKIIELQQQEQHRLEQMLKVKTKDIQQLLEEKELLYKELNHRIKNNLQMMLSLLRLQLAKSNNQETKEALNSTKNRLLSFSHLYETLHSSPKHHLNLESYFKEIINTLQPHDKKAIKVTYKVDQELHIQKLLYLTLIVTELVTNAFKYAFKQEGELLILLKKEKRCFTLKVADNGEGFSSKQKDGLGITIIKTLVKNQLYGTIDIESNNQGTTITISWEEHE